MTEIPGNTVSHATSGRKQIILPEGSAVEKGFASKAGGTSPHVYCYSGMKLELSFDDLVQMDLYDRSIHKEKVGERDIYLFTMDDGHRYVLSDVSLPKSLDNLEKKEIVGQRLVPYDDWASRGELSLADFVGRLRDDFENSAESGICIKREAKDIQSLLELYKSNTLSDPYKRSLGALVIGAMIERMHVLAQEIQPALSAYLNEHQAEVGLDGGAIKQGIFDHNPKMSAVFEELGEYQEFLLIDVNDTMKQTVRTRSNATDRDGRLFEIATEVCKAFTHLAPVASVERNYNRSTKVAAAMEGLDRLGGDLQKLADLLPAESQEFSNVRDGTKEVLQQFINIAVARVGVKPTDAPAYEIATMKYKAAKDVLKEVYKSVRDLTLTPGQQPSNSPAALAIEQISKGIEMVDDISRLHWDLPVSRDHFAQRVQRLQKMSKERAQGIALG